MKLIISIFIAISGIYFPLVSNAQVSKKIKRALKKELGENPEIIVFADNKKLKSSVYFADFSLIFKRAIKNNIKKCNVFTPQNIDYGILAVSNIASPNMKGLMVMKGSFSTRNYYSCMVKNGRLIKTHYLGFKAYCNKRRSEYYFSPVPAVIISVTGKWRKKLKPYRGLLGMGKIGTLSTNKILETEVKKLPKKSPVKKFNANIRLTNGKLKIFADVDLISKSNLSIAKQVISGIMLSPVFKPFKTDFSVKYSRKGLKLTQNLDLLQFQLAVSMMKKFFFKKKKNNKKKARPKKIYFNGSI